MSRKEAINTFANGLITDLNPIMTPNSALTDCLNGTLITYNGNEYSLQNDMGNFPLKNCKLPANYVPVGVKEYGDILYIVSYNPLTKHTQIGSYPAPQRLSDMDTHSGMEQEYTPITEALLGLATADVPNPPTATNYRYIVESFEKLTVFYSNPPEEYKLNPGDQYQFGYLLDNVASSLPSYPYETLEFYIIDDNRKTYLISDYVNFGGSDFSYLKWDVPGWLAFKPRFASIDEFRVNVRKIIAPRYLEDVTLELNLQLLTSDPIFTSMADECGDLYVDIVVYKEHRQSASPNDSSSSESEESESNEQVISTSSNAPQIPDSTTVAPSGTTEIGTRTNLKLSKRVILGNGTHIYYANYNPDTDDDTAQRFHITCTDNDVLTIKVTPKLKVCIDEGHDIYHEVIYDEHITTTVFNIGQKGSVNDLSIGLDRWWYKTDPLAKTLLLQFNTTGLDSSAVLEEDAYLFYSIRRLDGSYVLDKSGQKYITKPYPGWNVIGETIYTFDLEEFNQTNWEDDLDDTITDGGTSVTTTHKRFFPEDIYVMEFSFYADNEALIPLNKTVRKLIVASELMNPFADNGYDTLDTVTFDQWMGNYLSYIKNKSISASNLAISGSPTPTLNASASYNAWNTEFSNVYTTFFTEDVYNSTLEKGFNVEYSAEYIAAFDYNSEVQLLNGPLWMYLNNTSTLGWTNGSTVSSDNFGQYTGKISAQDKHYTGASTITLTDKYKVSPIGDKASVMEYSVRDLKSNINKTTGGVDNNLFIKGTLNNPQANGDLTIAIPPGTGINRTSTEYTRSVSDPSNTIIDSLVKTTVAGKDPAYQIPVEDPIAGTIYTWPDGYVPPKYDIVGIDISVSRPVASNSSGNNKTQHINLYKRTQQDAETRISTSWDEHEDPPYHYFCVGFATRYNGHTIFGFIDKGGATEADIRGQLKVFLQNSECVETGDINNGYFCQAEEDGDREASCNVGGNLVAKINFGSFKYGDNKDMYNQNDRNSLLSILGASTFDNVDNLLGVSLEKLSYLELGSIDITDADILNQLNLNAFYTALDTAKAAIKQKSSLAPQQQSACNSDSIVQNYTSGQRVYRYKQNGTPTPGYTSLYNAMNSGFVSDYDFLSIKVDGQSVSNSPRWFTVGLLVDYSLIN